MIKVGLAKHAYVGAPRGVAHVWPDDVDWSALPDWSFDEALKTHVHRSRRPTISLDEAIAALMSKGVSR